MIPFTSLIGLLEHAVILSAITLSFTKILTFKFRLFIFIIAFIIAWIPVDGLFTAGYLRGAMGDLSVSTMFLIIIYILRSLFGLKLSAFENAELPACIVFFTGIFFYPMALGLFMVDPYGMAYNPRVLSIFLFAIALLAWYFKNHLTVACICAAVTAYIFRILESDNLWDYILDPVIFIIAVVYLFFKLIKGKKEKNEHSIQ